jgi:hypothetical protein
VEKVEPVVMAAQEEVPRELLAIPEKPVEPALPARKDHGLLRSRLNKIVWIPSIVPGK